MSHRHSHSQRLSHSQSLRHNQRHGHSHLCPACNRPRHGLTADEVFDTMTRRLNPALIALRVRALRRLAQRIGTCDCELRFFAPPPVAASLVANLVAEKLLVAERLIREAA
jgi:hypothetical protein